MMARIPVCKRECEEAVSHAESAAVSGVGMGVDSSTGIADGEGREVEICSAALVAIGDGTGVEVVVMAMFVPVGDRERV